ncbi:MAG: hypothetical protein QHH05_00985, partial [Syntrophomonadaceae bacterium]|nr:hypothetical protein [Syntrophomonadaceae bacterium]
MKTVMMTRGAGTALPCGQPAVPGASCGVRARGEFAGLLQQVAPEGSPGARSRAPGHLQDPQQVGPPGLALGQRLREAGPATGTGEGGQRREQLAVLLGAAVGGGEGGAQPSAPAGQAGAEGAPAVSDTHSTGCEESLTALAAAQAATAGPGTPGEGEETGEGDPGQAAQAAAEPVLLAACDADARDTATATAIAGLPAMAIVPATAAGSAPAPEAISAPPAAAQPDAVLPGEPVLVSIEAATVNTAGLPGGEACAGPPQPDLQSHAQPGAEAGARADRAEPQPAAATDLSPVAEESARSLQQCQPLQEAPQAAPGAVEGSEQDQDTSAKAPR